MAITSAIKTIDSYSVGIGNAMNNLGNSIEKSHELSIIESLAELGSRLSTAGYYLAWIPYNFERFVNFFSTTPWVQPIVQGLKALNGVPMLWTLGFAGSIGNSFKMIQYSSGLVQIIRFQNIFRKYAWRGCPPPDQQSAWLVENPKSRLLKPSLVPMDTEEAEAFYQAGESDPRQNPQFNCFLLVYHDPNPQLSRKIVREKMVVEKEGTWRIYSPTDPDWNEDSYTFDELLQKLGLKAAEKPPVETIDRAKAILKLESQAYVLRKDKVKTISLEQALSNVAAFTLNYYDSNGDHQKLKVLQHEGKYEVYSQENEYLDFYHSQHDLLEAYGPLKKLSSEQSQEGLKHIGVEPSEEMQSFELLSKDQGVVQRDIIVLYQGYYYVFSSLVFSVKDVFSSKRDLFASYDLPKEPLKPRDDAIVLLEKLAEVNPLLLERSLPEFLMEELTIKASEYPQTLAKKLSSDDSTVEEAHIVLEHQGKLQTNEANGDLKIVQSLLHEVKNFSIQDYLKVLAIRMRRGHKVALTEGAKLLERMNTFSLRKADWMAICLVGSLVAIAGCIGFFVAFPLAITIALTILGIALTSSAFFYRRFVVENPTGKFYPVVSGFLPQSFNEWKKRRDEIDELFHRNLSAYSFFNSPL